MQNNRCIGPIHAVAQSVRRCACQSHGVGSNLICVIFGHIFIELFFLFTLKTKTTNARYVNTNSISQHTHTHMSEVEVYSVNKLKF